MLKLKVLLLLVLSVISFGVFSLTLKEECMLLDKQINSLRDQLPIEVDFVTTMTGVQALYLNSKCTLNYNYVVDTPRYAEAMIEDNDSEVEENLRWLETKEGRAALKDSIAEIARQSGKLMVEQSPTMKNYRIIYLYSFEEADIAPIVGIGNE